MSGRIDDGLPTLDPAVLRLPLLSEPAARRILDLADAETRLHGMRRAA